MACSHHPEVPDSNSIGALPHVTTCAPTLKPLHACHDCPACDVQYTARSFGVTKLQGITEAKERCPGLILISGEDLTPYRRASKEILAVLQRFGVAERLGMDEVRLSFLVSLAKASLKVLAMTLRKRRSFWM